MSDPCDPLSKLLAVGPRDVTPASARPAARLDDLPISPPPPLPRHRPSTPSPGVDMGLITRPAATFRETTELTAPIAPTALATQGRRKTVAGEVCWWCLGSSVQVQANNVPGY